MTDYKCNACGKVLEYEYATCACGNQQPEAALREMAEEQGAEKFTRERQAANMIDSIRKDAARECIRMICQYVRDCESELVVSVIRKRFNLKEDK